MTGKTSKAELDSKTLESLIKLYCKDKHQGRGGLCPDCNDLLEYSLDKYSHCALKEDGKLCSDCKIHCYDQAHRQQILKVMRYSGPRLLMYHPVLALRYLIQKVSAGKETEEL